MALSEVHNLSAILSNNGFAIGKGDTIQHAINMLEVSPNSYPSERCGKNEDLNWNYNVLEWNLKKNMNVEDDDSQELNNSMVNDLVSKILDDDSVISDNICSNSYNTNAQPELNIQLPSVDRIENNLTACINDLIDFNISSPTCKLLNGTCDTIDIGHNCDKLCNGLSTPSFNICTEQQLNQGYLSGDGIAPNAYLSDSQCTLHPDKNYFINKDNLTMANSPPMLYGTSYTKQSVNWSEPLPTPRFTKDLFRNDQWIHTYENPDLNFNIVLDSSEQIRNNETEYRNGMDQHAASSSQNATMINVHDSYNTSNNCRSYGYNPSMTDFNAESDFLTNSSLQHYSSTDRNLHNRFENNIYRNSIGEYKDFNEPTKLNMTHVALPSDQIQCLQQQISTYKSDRTMDQDYKHTIDYYPTLKEHIASSSGNLDTNENICYSSSVEHGLDKNLIKLFGSKPKLNETKLYSPIGFPKNISSRNLNQTDTKYGHHNYQYRGTSSGDVSKMLLQDPTSYRSNVKQTLNCAYSDGYTPTNKTIPSGNHLGNQIASTILDKGPANYVMKQRHYVPRLHANIPAVSPSDILLNSRLVSRTNAVTPGVFPSMVPIPIPVAVPPLYSMFYGGGGVNLRTGSSSARRTGPSSILHFRLEQTYVQFKQLEKERKKCEAGLAAHFPGKRVTSANKILIPQLTGNPSRVDRLVIDYLREHARVITLIAKMERLRGATMNQRVHKAMEYWLEAIKYVQECRKKEIANATKRHNENPHCIPMYNDTDILTLAGSVHELTKGSRYARTGMYNAMQATLLFDLDVENKVIETHRDSILASSLPDTLMSSGTCSYPRGT